MQALRQQINNQYSLNQEISLSLIRESSDNCVYLIKDLSAKYILRVSRKDKSNDIPFETELIEQLKSANYPVPSIIKNKSGQLYSVLKSNEVCILFKFIEGTQIVINPEHKPDLEQVKTAAKSLASLHNISKKLKVQHSTTRTIQTELNKALLIEDILITQFDGGADFIKQIKEMICWAEKIQINSLIIHNDFRAHNLIFSEDKQKINAVIDFDWSCYGPAEKDLALALCEWSFPDGAEHMWDDIFQVFLRSYNEGSENQFNDNDHLKKWIAFSCLSDAATYFYDRITNNTLNKKVLSSYMYKKYKYFSKL